MSISTLASKIISILQADSFRWLFMFLLIISVTTLASAYYVEYVMNIAPCPLCIYQRIPYLGLIKISITGLIFHKLSKYTLICIELTLLTSIVLAGYHSGVERGIFEPSSFCSTTLTIPHHLSISEIKKMIYDAPVTSCTKAALKIFDLSMAEWNLILNLFLFALVAYIAHIRKEHAETKL